MMMMMHQVPALPLTVNPHLGTKPLPLNAKPSTVNPHVSAKP
jgi:hypothetical protein